MKIVHKVIHTCEEASRLMVQEADVKFSPIQRFRLWLHLQMCDACRRFKIQNDWIDKQMANLLPDEDVVLDQKKKEEIKNQLDEELGK